MSADKLLLEHLCRGLAEIKPGFLHSASRRVRSEANTKKKAPACFGRNDKLPLPRARTETMRRPSNKITHGVVLGL